MNYLKSSFLVVFWVLLATMLAACNFGDGSTLYVSPEGNDQNSCTSVQTSCETIQAAIDKAEADTTIIVAEGTYSGFAIRFSEIGDRHLHLQGEGPQQTIILSDFGSAAIVNHETTIVEGMTIADGSPGIENNGGTLVINNSEIFSSLTAGIVSGNGDVTITNSSLANNDAPGITVIGGSLNIANSTISANNNQLTDYGGGIQGLIGNTCPTITVRSSTIIDNRTGSSGAGGGIFTCGDLSIFSTTISDNSAGDGGAIAVIPPEGETPTLLIVDSTLAGNAAQFSGGAIWTELATIVLSNTTVSGNFAQYGGGIYKVNSDLWTGSVTIGFSTIANNISDELAGGLEIGGAAPQNTFLYGSIITDNNGAYNCGGLYPSGGANMERGESCGFSEANDLSHTDPMLGPLSDNGGPTLTHALLNGSPAIDRANHADCPEKDQRGETRPIGFLCDIGAFESDFPQLATEQAPQQDPSPTSITPTANIPTPATAPSVSTSVDTNCRSGPSTSYQPSDTLEAGEMAPITGRLADNSWWRITLSTGSCWVSNAIVLISGDTAGVPIITPPALPTNTPTTPPLIAPTLISPSGTLNCASASSGVTLSWSAVSHPNNIDYYEWALEGPISDSGTTSNLEANTVSLSCAGANYQWRVRAIDDLGNVGPWSSYLSFNVP